MMEPFENLIQEHGPRVWRVCRAVLPAGEVEDAWQETFLAALTAHGSTPVRNPRAWLMAIAHNTCADFHRRRYREGHRAPLDEAAAHPAGGGEADVDAGDIWRIVALLPDKQRWTIAYHYLGGLTYEEVARILGGTAAAARRAAADGRRRLRTMLEDTQ